jgi:uncharacterized protein YggE
MLFAAAATFAAFPTLAGAQESTPRPTPTPAPCARPNVAATTVRGAPAIAPPMAEQQGIQGTVQVVISLDEYSRVVGARIQTSPSAILNPAALAAARASTFQTEIRDCRPLAGDYIYSVEFENKATFSTTASGERTVSVVGEGTVGHAADLAYVQATITTRGEVDAATAAAKNDAAFAALNAKLAALGIAAPSPRDAVPIRAADGYGALRYVEIAVDKIANVERTVAAASSVPPVVVTAIRFALRDSERAQREALNLALKDAETSARTAVATQQARLVVRHVIVPPNDRARPPSVVVPFRLVPVVGGFTQPQVRVPEVQTRATATVTYAIKP